MYFGPGSQASTDYLVAHAITFPKFANPADHLSMHVYALIVERLINHIYFSGYSDY